MFYTNYARLCGQIHKSTYAVATECGVRSTATLAGWKNGAVPRPKVVDKMVEYFNSQGLHITAADLFAETEEDTPFVSKDDLTAIEVREILRDRPEVKILFDAMKDAPASVLLETAARIMRLKEESENK